MIGYLHGNLVDITPAHTYLDVNGVGYDVQITLHTYEAIKDANKCKLYTHLQVREDAWTLYGFATTAERSTFQRLLSVSGVGAATARLMLSSLSAADLNGLIIAGDSKALERLKGIGAKTAQRIILELKGKIDFKEDALPEEVRLHNNNVKDALNALIGLGIAKNMAEAVLKKVKDKNDLSALSVEELVKLALKNL